MSKIAYINRSFRPNTLSIIKKAEEICEEYAAQGYDLTLRQLYYQFVAKGLIPNKDTEYDRLGSIINDARLAGKIDWDHISDRTRNLQAWEHFDDPADWMQSATRYYSLDKWEDQPFRVEVWVEKEALAGIVSQVASRWDCPYFSCRGYVSQSEMHAAGKRLRDYLERGQKPVIIHLGDHDPSGIDMTRDVEERLLLFMTDGDRYGEDIEEQKALIDLQVDRIALNMDQIRQYNPPPNPAKLTDSRCTAYIEKYGASSWELDALSPAQMDALITNAIREYLDEEKWDDVVKRQKQERTALINASDHWEEIQSFVAGVAQ